MKLSLAARIFLGYAAVLATFGAVSIFSVAELHSNQREIRLLSQGYLPLSQDIATLETFQGNHQKDTERILEEKSPDTRRALVRLARLYFPAVVSDRLSASERRGEQALALAPKSEAPFVRDVLARIRDLSARCRGYEDAAERAFAELDSPASDPAQVTKHAAQLKQLEASLSGDIRLLRLSLEDRIRKRVEQAEHRERRTGLTIITLSLLAIGVGLLATLLSSRTLRPVRTLIAGVSRIGQGDYTAKLGLRGDDEISLLAREFDQLAKSLQEREAQLKEKQEALVRAQQLATIGRLAAHVAHEVRNPLSSIGLNVELLEEALTKARFDSPKEGNEAKDLISAMVREIDRLTEITEQYLGMGRLPQPQLLPEDVNGVLGQVLDFSKEELERAQVRVERRLDPTCPRTLADENQLRQVFLNLLRNSREAMAQGGRLTVSTQVQDGVVEVAFVDTGRGLSQNTRGQLFEPFFSTKSGGTGLGLAISRQIIQAHGGSIACQDNPGGGAIFVIRLPRA